MDINELMIDNYLSWGEDKIVKVQMLRREYENKIDVRVLYNDSVNLWVSSDYDDIYSLNIKDLKPLELSEEMLLNNDFKFTDPWFYNEECTIRIKKAISQSG